MYPFKTNQFQYVLNLSEDEFLKILNKEINENKIFSLKNDDLFYGKVFQNKAVFNLGNHPSYNSLRPIVHLTWNKSNDKLILNGYFSLDKKVIFCSFILAFFGIYLSFQIKMIVPFIVTFLISLFFLYVFNQIFYRLSKKKTMMKIKSMFNSYS